MRRILLLVAAASACPAAGAERQATRTKEACAAGWKRDAAPFIPAGERRVDSMVRYYLDTRLRAAPAERDRFCRPLR